MIDKRTKHELFQWAKDARRIQIKFILNTRVLTPVNYHAERERFLSSKRYNPRYSYQTPYIANIKRQIHDLSKRLEAIDLPPELTAYLESFIKHLLLAARTRNAVGTDRFSYHAQKMYNYDINTTKTVKSHLPKILFAPTAGASLYDAERIREHFQSYIDDHPHIDSAVVEVDHFNDHTIRVGHKRLTIGSAVKRNQKNVKRLVVHEIESHMLQRRNLIELDNPLLHLRKLHEKDLYAEGMAVYNEAISGTMTEKTYELYLLRHIAVEMLDKSFREIFDYMTQYVPKNKAFVITYRVKRGMQNTKKPGGFPKDASYLLGYRAILDYLAEGGKLEMLYISPIPELGQLLLKYNLLPVTGHKTPLFWK